MRSFVALFLMLLAIWQLSSGRTIDLGEATLAIAAAWFVTLFLVD
jgi:hypothetical protein